MAGKLKELAFDWKRFNGGLMRDDVATLGVLLTVVAVEFFIICAGRMIPMQPPDTMEHLTRKLKDMTNAKERLGMKWKEKSLAIVAGPYADYKAGDTSVITSNKGARMGMVGGGRSRGIGVVAGCARVL